MISRNVGRAQPCAATQALASWRAPAPVVVCRASSARRREGGSRLQLGGATTCAAAADETLPGLCCFDRGDGAPAVSAGAAYPAAASSEVDVSMPTRQNSLDRRVEAMYCLALEHARAGRLVSARAAFRQLTTEYPHACRCWLSWAQVGTSVSSLKARR